MKYAFRWISALLSAVMLCLAALFGLCWYATTGIYAGRALGNDALLMQQQAHIDAKIAALADTWHFSPDTLAPWTADAARTHRTALQTWWQDLWHSQNAEPYLPMYLTASDERNMVAALLADETFIAATPADRQRVIARDDIAYAVDKTICESVLPLRRSVVDLALTLGTSTMDLPMLARLLRVSALCLLCVSLLLIALARKAAGSTLTSSGLMMLLISLPIWQLDIPGMLDQLNPIAEAQGIQALLWLGLPWYAVASLLILIGCAIIRARN